jgi:hypothetical protein
VIGHMRTARTTTAFGGTTLLRQRKYTALLALLLVVVVFQSFALTNGSQGIGRDLVATVLGVAILLVVFERSAMQVVMAVFLLIAISIGWERQLHVSSIFDDGLRVTQAAALASFYWVVVWAILRSLFRTPVIGAENVIGAICGYNSSAIKGTTSHGPKRMKLRPCLQRIPTNIHPLGLLRKQAIEPRGAEEDPLIFREFVAPGFFFIKPHAGMIPRIVSMIFAFSYTSFDRISNDERGYGLSFVRGRSRHPDSGGGRTGVEVSLTFFARRVLPLGRIKLLQNGLWSLALINNLNRPISDNALRRVRIGSDMLASVVLSRPARRTHLQRALWPNR